MRMRIRLKLNNEFIMFPPKNSYKKTPTAICCKGEIKG